MKDGGESRNEYINTHLTIYTFCFCGYSKNAPFLQLLCNAKKVVEGAIRTICCHFGWRRKWKFCPFISSFLSGWREFPNYRHGIKMCAYYADRWGQCLIICILATVIKIFPNFVSQKCPSIFVNSVCRLPSHLRSPLSTMNTFIWLFWLRMIGCEIHRMDASRPHAQV